MLFVLVAVYRMYIGCMVYDKNDKSDKTDKMAISAFLGGAIARPDRYVTDTSPMGYRRVFVKRSVRLSNLSKLSH